MVDAARGAPVTDPAAPDQASMWLALLRQLTASCPGWMTMKGVESALTAKGDVDSIAPEIEWSRVVDRFHTWALDHGLGPVVVCPHAPYLLHLVALSNDRPEFFELDVNRRKIFLGSTLFRPEDVAPMSLMDERGFRRLRPGAEGVLKLVQNGMFRDGRPNTEGLQAKGVRDLLASDREGVGMAATLFGRASGSVIRASDAVVRGSWDRSSLLRMQAWCVLRGVREPDAGTARLRFRHQKKRCPVLRSVFENARCVPGDRAAWLERVATSHEILA
jgi:hypothetical protein